jgi:adenine-specific DNA-methyltransferase
VTLPLVQELFLWVCYTKFTMLKIPIEDSKGLKAKSPADLKKHIIEESIYGVDIDSGAVDIARLRFWLSLVVDEVAPQPLPNLSF